MNLCALSLLFAGHLAQDNSGQSKLQEPTPEIQKMLAVAPSHLFLDKDPEEYLKSIIVRSSQISDIAGRAKAEELYGQFQEQTGQYAKAIEMLERAASDFLEVKDFPQCVSAQLSRSRISAAIGDIESGLKFANLALKFSATAKSPNLRAASYSAIAGLYVSSGNQQKAIENFKLAITFYEVGEDRHGIATALSNIGNCSLKQRNFSVAQTYFLQAIKIGQEVGDKHLIASVVLHIAECFLEYSRSSSIGKRIEASFKGIGKNLTGNKEFEASENQDTQTRRAWNPPDDDETLTYALQFAREAMATIDDIKESSSILIVGDREALELEKRADLLIADIYCEWGKPSKAVEYLTFSLRKLIETWPNANILDLKSKLQDVRHQAGYRDIHGFLVGIEKYQQESAIGSLQFAVKDVESIAVSLKNDLGIPANNITVLTNKAATAAAISQALRNLRTYSKPEDTIIFGFSGHGFRALRSKEIATLVPFDFDTKKDDSGISVPALKNMLDSIPAMNQVVILDSSDSGTKGNGFLELGNVEEPDLLKKNVLFIGQSGSAYESVAMQHGVLTVIVLEGLKKHSTAKSLSNYINELTEEDVLGFFSTNGAKTAFPMKPVARLVGDDFPLSPVIPKKEGTLFSVRKGKVSYQDKDLTRAESTAKPKEDNLDAVLKSSKSRILVVGNSIYDDPRITQLRNPEPDAKSLLEVLKNDYEFEAFDPLYNATYKDFYQALLKVKKTQFGPYDQLVVYIAGHAAYDDFNRDAFLMFRDSKKDDVTLENYFQFAKLRNILQSIGCSRVLVILDVCHAAAFDMHSLEEVGNRPREEPLPGIDPKNPYKMLDPTKALARLMCDKTKQLFAATSNPEHTVKDGQFDHSPFAWTLLDALRRYARAMDHVTPEQLKAAMYRLEEKPLLTHFGDSDPGSEFVFVVKRK